MDTNQSVHGIDKSGDLERYIRVEIRLPSGGQQTITIPLARTAIEIEKTVFAGYYKGNITSVVLSKGIQTIGDNTFSNCSRLASITFPKSLTAISSGAFWLCSSLVSITLPESLKTIGSGAFYGCSSLVSIALPESLTTIGSCAFFGCSRLASITLPESLTAIGNNAFVRCSRLASITLPESLTTVGSDAFLRCNGLEVIYIKTRNEEVFERIRGLLPEHLRGLAKPSSPAKSARSVIDDAKAPNEPTSVASLNVVAQGGLFA